MTWRGRDHVGPCLDALQHQRPHRTIVVDNASDDGTADVLAARPETAVRLPANVGYAGALAAALDRIDTEFVAWLNDDAEPAPDWLATLEQALDDDPGAAAVSSTIVLHDGRTQSVGVKLTEDGHGADHTGEGDVFGFNGGAALVRTAALKRAGGVPKEFFCYYEDTDTSWRLRLAGHRVITSPARVRHRHGASTRPGSRLFHRWNERNRLLMLLRCAPAGIAAAQLARFVALTLVLPLRRRVPAAWNFRFGLRVQVVGEVFLRMPVVLAQRGAIGRRSTVSRHAVWTGRLEQR
ncbi:glycosyltransferase family 2 protein [Saccharothrix violaceirubra]